MDLARVSLTWKPGALKKRVRKRWSWGVDSCHNVTFVIKRSEVHVLDLLGSGLRMNVRAEMKPIFEGNNPMKFLAILDNSEG